MQVQDPYSVARRPLDIEDYVDIVRRHKSWIFGPIFAAVVVSVVGAFLWPDTYVSTATVRVVPQTVPESYVQANVNQGMSDRISAIAESVTSRSTLTTIITSFGLYPREVQRLPMEDIVEKMRKDIRIDGVSPTGNSKDHVPAFQIHFSYTDRYMAQKIVTDLVSRFININQRERSAASLNTTNLLRDQWDIAKKELDALENKLADFRVRNQGRLPDEMQQNLQQMSSLQQRVSTVNGALSRVSQEKLMLETQLRIYKDQLNNLTKDSSPPAEAAVAKNERLAESEREVRFYENQLAALRDHYKDTHPDVQRAIQMLASAKKKKEQIAKEQEANKPDPSAAATPRTITAPAAREARDIEGAIRRAQGQVEAKDIEAEGYRKELASINTQMKMYQGRLEGTPFSQKEYAELSRDRDLARQKFVDLDLKVTKAMLAQNMEDRKVGEALELLDAPSLPETPTQPKRPAIVGIGTILGLVIGLVLAGAREMQDTSLKNMKDVRAYTKLPILGSVPLLENDLIVRKRRRMGWVVWALACLGGCGIMAGSILYYFMTRV